MIAPHPQELRVLEVLKALDVRPEKAATVEIEARKLFLVYGLRAPISVHSALPKGTEAAREGLVLAYDLAWTLLTTLNELPQEADALLTEEFGGPFPYSNWRKSLLKAHDAMDTAIVKLDAMPTQSAPLGAPKKWPDPEFREYALGVYERLTGKNATVSAAAENNRAGRTPNTPYGPFLDYFVSLFSVLELAKPEAQAKKAAKEKRARLKAI